MRVLIDERAVRALKRYLTTVGHECLTVQEVGWTGKQNGELLSLAEASFDRRLTLDTNLSCQQNLTGRKIAIVVLGRGRWSLIRLVLAQVVRAINEAKPGSYAVVEVPGKR